MALGDSTPPPDEAPWADEQRSYRLPLNLEAAPVARAATFTDVPVNVPNALIAAGGAGTPDPATIRAVEVNAQGVVIDANVDTQFDQTPGAATGLGTPVPATEAPTPRRPPAGTTSTSTSPARP